ncbi:MAG: uncharacterized protein KVP18_003573 [Porospora cf. gigantea A]|uniref:uncharacterized protein n=1 Tax=Porospora cf. gigantea A TaxID=2853593 RepID=UPI00355A8B53|nr:MAG: hypothetical protein KVP18_003573 [Porospora cf. gigantea A]
MSHSSKLPYSLQGGKFSNMQPERPTELPPLPHHGPLNSSSALVPGDTAFALRSLVNQVVPTSCVDLCLPHLLFRPPTAEDGMQVLDLHRELFPLEYDSTFYDAAVGITPGVAALGLWLPTERLEELLRRPLYGLPPELLVGIVTLARDGFLIGVAHSVDVLWRHGEYVADPIKTFGSPVQCSKKLSYILTLGVSETFRRRGLASLLVQKAIQLLKTGRLLDFCCITGCFRR